MVHNHGRGTVIIMDNHTTAMTGHQDHPGNDYTLMGQPTRRVDIENLVRSLGVEKVMSVDAFDVKAMQKALKACTRYDGTAVIIARGPCVFVSRNPQPAYAVDPEVCVACGTCTKAGCPAIIRIDDVNPKTQKKKAGIDPVLCVGCDICRQICPTGAIAKPES
jgi:indolepyruvate ferredoxin oxidoreductase alpha subunit